jgi:hypothetical protein
MPTTSEKVLEETKRFHQALPELLSAHRDHWVVFMDGKVKSQHASEQEAYADAVKTYGRDGGFVIAKVVEVSSTPITAGVLFGIA